MWVILSRSVMVEERSLDSLFRKSRLYFRVSERTV